MSFSTRVGDPGYQAGLLVNMNCLDVAKAGTLAGPPLSDLHSVAHRLKLFDEPVRFTARLDLQVQPVGIPLMMNARSKHGIRQGHLIGEDIEQDL